ncbi:MAG: Ig-like domain-containing protein [Prevotella sp.]|nr:Ig-like domain-containing protein [Prevotella sp.]
MTKKIKSFLIPMLLSIFMATSCSDTDEQQQFKIFLDPDAITMTEGATADIVVKGVPEGAKVEWKSENQQVAKVTDGKVEAVAKGTTNIEVTATLNGAMSKATCAVTVEENPAKKAIPFADNNLKKQILALSTSPDANKDGEISVEEAKTVTTLDFHFETKDAAVEDKIIKDIKGLEYFVNLDTLNLKNQFVTDASPIFKLNKMEQLILGENNISTLDVSAMTELKDLRLYGNANLTSLDLKNNTKLEQLYIQRTALTTLDLTPLKKLTLVMANKARLTSIRFSGLPELNRIELVENDLQEIDASDLPQLMELHANGNRLKTVTLKNLPSLQRLNLYGNNLSAIDLNLPKLMFLFLHDNNFKTLDFSKLPMLFTCIVSNNPMEKIDFSSNTIISNIEATYMSNLKEIDLKNNNFNEDGEYLIIEGNTVLKKIRVDAGDEETLVKRLTANRPDIEVTTE